MIDCQTQKADITVWAKYDLLISLCLYEPCTARWQFVTPYLMTTSLWNPTSTEAPFQLHFRSYWKWVWKTGYNPEYKHINKGLTLKQKIKGTMHGRLCTCFTTVLSLPLSLSLLVMSSLIKIYHHNHQNEVISYVFRGPSNKTGLKH